MKVFALLFLLVFPAYAVADDWHGFWASDPGHCRFKDQVGEHDPTPIPYSETEFVGLENQCAVKSSERIGDISAWRLVLTCTGEGTTYDDERLLMLSEDDRLWEFDGIWEPLGYTRCE